MMGDPRKEAARLLVNTVKRECRKAGIPTSVDDVLKGMGIPRGKRKGKV